METRIHGNLVDIHKETIFSAEIIVRNGKVHSINQTQSANSTYILPGFIDSHIHIESSLLIPENFAKVALSHGTIATVSDPHEIANVCGVDGVRYMIRNGKKSLLKYFWTAPSCVPATSFETSGAVLDPKDLDILFQSCDIVALGEMMNYPGVIHKDVVVHEKCKIARDNHRVIDGHAPGISGKDLREYVSVGISTDHECAFLTEALEKLEIGMKILIREGSSAKNFEALYSLLESHPDKVMLCSDDLHADDLLLGHINLLVKRALSKGVSLYNVLRAVSANPVEHYGLPVGLLRVGDPADFIVVDNLTDFSVLETWVDGSRAFKKGVGASSVRTSTEFINAFDSDFVSKEDLKFMINGSKVRVINVEEGSLFTKTTVLNIDGGFDLFLYSNQLLKLYVKNRYTNGPVSKAIVNGFGKMDGAIASTIAHDSHNIIAIGNSYEDIEKAINLLVESKGGISFVHTASGTQQVLALPVGGLMSGLSAQEVAKSYNLLLNLTYQHGCILSSPLMTLSFLALLVIPSLKLSDKGLFDVEKFSFTDLFLP